MARFLSLGGDLSNRTRWLPLTRARSSDERAGVYPATVHATVALGESIRQQGNSVPEIVTHGAQLGCSEGSASSNLVVDPNGRSVDEQPMATESDHRAATNILPFGLCQSLQNPQVKSATAAASGALTPIPCQPVTPAKWQNGSSLVSIEGKAAVTSDSCLQCSWGGTIRVESPGSTVQLDG